jgi:hypothetical protein
LPPGLQILIHMRVVNTGETLTELFVVKAPGPKSMSSCIKKRQNAIFIFESVVPGPIFSDSTLDFYRPFFKIKSKAVDSNKNRTNLVDKSNLKGVAS